jgi:hypothetical protein
VPGPNADGTYGPFATAASALQVVYQLQTMGYPDTFQDYRTGGQYVFPRTAADGYPVVTGVLGPSGDGYYGYYGPFATINRAIQVKNILIAIGYSNTIEYHNGDGQYVYPRTYLPPLVS